MNYFSHSDSSLFPASPAEGRTIGTALCCDLVLLRMLPLPRGLATALHVAIVRQQLELASLLVSEYGMPAEIGLACAVYHGELAAAKLMLELGAVPNATSLFDLAINRQQPEMIRFLRSLGLACSLQDVKQAISPYANPSKLATLLALLEQPGLDLNAIDYGGIPLLATYDALDNMEVLLKHGARRGIAEAFDLAILRVHPVALRALLAVLPRGTVQLRQLYGCSEPHQSEIFKILLDHYHFPESYPLSNGGDLHRCPRAWWRFSGRQSPRIRFMLSPEAERDVLNIIHRIIPAIERNEGACGVRKIIEHGGAILWVLDSAIATGSVTGSATLTLRDPELLLFFLSRLDDAMRVNDTQLLDEALESGNPVCVRLLRLVGARSASMTPQKARKQLSALVSERLVKSCAWSDRELRLVAMSMHC